MENKKLENFLNLSLDQVMSDRFGRYSKYIIQDRALPDARDGLKPVQRRIIYSMNDLGLTHNKAFKKSARVVGEVIGKYHPHGDSSIYEAMVRMSQDWKMNMPLIEMHGNNGSIDDDPAAAMRYTEARLSKVASSLINNIKKDTVLFAPNFDDSEKEPTVLPALFPNMLVNGAKGIAAGYATEMPPHNLGEVIDATIAKIQSPNIRLETLMNYIKGPDFPTGGIVQGKDGMYQAFERGRGRVVIRSKYTINDSKTKPAITITEIPYGVIKSKLVRDMDEIRFNNKISGIKEVRDETDRNGTTIQIELNAGTDPYPVVNYLLAKTELQVYYNYNSVAIKDKVPTLMSLNEILSAYLNHQIEIQTRAINFVLVKDKKRLEIIEGLIKVSRISDEVIEVIKNAEGSKAGVVKALVNTFDFTELQATAIAELRLYRLSRTDQSVYLEEREELLQKIAINEGILSSEDAFNNYMISILKELKKEFAVPRKSVLQDVMETISINMDALIKHEEAWVGISQDGYIKKFSNRVMEANNTKDYKLKEGDALIYLNKINTAEKLLVFTNKGNYYFIPGHKIADVKFKEVGKNLNDFATKGIDEKIVDVISVSDFTKKCFINLVSTSGKAKRVLVKDFEVSRFTKTYKALKLSGTDELVGAKISNGFKNLLIITAKGKAVFYSENQLPVQGPKSAGVKGISLSGDNFVTAFVLATESDVIGLVSKRGGAKRVKVSSISPMSRTTQGKQLYREIKGNPHIITDSRVVTTNTNAIYTKDIISKETFANVPITTTEEGFSQHGPTMVRMSKISNYDKVYKDNPFLEIPEGASEDEIFDKAEQKIKDIDQIDIDELLKDL